MGIMIRGIEYQPAEFEDRDIVAIASLASPNAYTVERTIREREAVEVLRLIFPDISEEITKGGRVRLSMAELNQLVQDLMMALLDNPEYRAIAVANPEMAPLLEAWAVEEFKPEDEFAPLRSQIEESDAEDEAFLEAIEKQIAAAKNRTERNGKAKIARRTAKGFGDR